MVVEIADAGFMEKLLAGALALLATAFSWGWGHTHKRIDDGEARMKTMNELVLTRASNEELTRTRDQVGMIFDRISEIEKSTGLMFANLQHQNHIQHADLLERMQERHLKMLDMVHNALRGSA